MISLGAGESNNVQFNGIIVVGGGTSANDQHHYYNSIRIGGTATGTFSSHGFVRGDNTATSPTHPVDLKNNIIYMERTGGGSVNYAIASQGAGAAVDWISDHNDLYNSATANIGFWIATGYNFANWQATSLGDANSVSVLPNFVSTTDLHLLANNCGLDGYGTPIAGITTDYDAQLRDAGAPDMGADEFTATYGTTLAGVIGSAVCDNKNVSATGTTYATSVCDLIAKVLPSGGTEVSGKINVCVTLDAAQQYFNGDPYVIRHHDVSPVTNPTTSTATISLYFTDAEFISYNTLNPVRPPMPTSAGGGSADPDRANVLVTVFFGTPTTSPSQPGFYTIGTRAVINPLDANITWNGNYWTVTFDVTGFGGYYVHSNIFGAPLPISINYFTGVKQGSNHLLNWKVTCNSTLRATMILERSADSRNFTPINSITADAARCNQPFDYTDAQPLPGMNYYRLKMIDDNGTISYSGIVALLNAVKGFEIISIAPNPVTTGNFKLNITSATAVTMQVIITDMQGRTVSRQSIPVVAGFSSIPMNAGNLAAGTYTIQGIIAGEKSRIIRFIKQ
ncbi:MAG: T9SS type A sorting domain-containing protein [Chitinophagaceae bacterium]|nr:T9SS type A sorting domain-containing protein [Chitinophagaceae bacterium]